jgi:hypothetical protein
MKNTMLVWRTRPESHQKAVAQFTSGKMSSPAGVEIVSHLHGIGIGFMLVTGSVEAIYAMCAEWASLVSIEAYQVLDNELALKALKG